MIFKRKIYKKLLEWKRMSGQKALLIEDARFKERFHERMGGCYVIHPKNLSLKDDIVCLPPYMTFCL